MTAAQPELRLSAPNDALARRCLRMCEYRDDLIRNDIPLPGDLNGLVAFAHRPFDTRSACIAVLPSSLSTAEDVAACRETGASMVFVAGETDWEAWAQGSVQPSLQRSLRPNEVENYFNQKREEFAPGTIFRAKTWLRAGVGRQLDFVDTGLLPMLEREAGARLLDIFERMVAVTMNGLRWDAVPDDAHDAHWLTQTNFWLLAAKLLHDKRVPRFIDLDFHAVPSVFERIALHYNRRAPSPPRVNGRLRALQAAAGIAAAPPHFRNISAETLGMLYEEALISPTTRKLLGTHRTPTYLVDYMMARLSAWIQELGHKRCRVFEPGCGHAPFLSGALRLVSDMLPPSIADDPKERHDFLRHHLRGCDNDPFGLEIARLSLTLADIPNENGWVLEQEDMFAGDALTRETRSATVVLANPPFEKEQAATFLQRTVPALQPGTVFGFVLPVNELTGAACEAVRRQLLKECEIKEISVFPDGMFKFASVETGIVLGRRLEGKSGAVPSGILFRRVRESKMEGFRERYEDSWRDNVDAKWLASANSGLFVVPELRKVWAACKNLPCFERFAEIRQGFTHRSNFPIDELESDSKVEGWKPGFADFQNVPETHLCPKTRWLNLSRKVILYPRGGLVEDVPQIVMNYAPVSRDVWRIKAYVDARGHPARSRMLLIRPKDRRVALQSIWALCNSPFANIYSFAQASKRDILVGLMRGMPVPDFSKCDLSRLEAAASTYRAAALDFTRSFPKAIFRANLRKKTDKSAPAGQMQLGISGEPADHELTAARERLRALHWRMDAEVLRLYALPPELEREVLDAFDGVRRVGVPFEQTRYIPREFRDVLTLDEFLRITDEWETTEERRCQLIEKRIKTGSRTAEAEAEFRRLQRLLTLHRRYYNKLPMVDTKSLKALLEEERAWESAK